MLAHIVSNALYVFWMWKTVMESATWQSFGWLDKFLLFQNVSNNSIGSLGCKAIADMLDSNTTLKSLSLAGGWWINEDTRIFKLFHFILWLIFCFDKYIIFVVSKLLREQFLADVVSLFIFLPILVYIARPELETANIFTFFFRFNIEKFYIYITTF